MFLPVFYKLQNLFVINYLWNSNLIGRVDEGGSVVVQVGDGDDQRNRLPLARRQHRASQLKNL